MKRVCAVLCMTGALVYAADTGQAALAGGDYTRALYRAEQAAADFHSRRDPVNEAIALNIAGSAHLHLGE